jgi:hypothetical protein
MAQEAFRLVRFQTSLHQCVDDNALAPEETLRLSSGGRSILDGETVVVESTEPVKWTWLRIGVVAASVSGLVFWCGAIAHWWQIPDSHRDGLEALGPVLATAMLVILVLPALVLGLTARWLPLAAVLALAVLLIVTDSLVPWFPWSWASSPP